MAPRAYWKGYLKLSLVSCAVALYPASSSTAKVSFHTLNRDTGNRLKRQMVDAETGEVVESDRQVRGYEIAKGHNIVIEDDELDAIALESTHTIDIERFVPREEIDELYLDSPYYIAPDDRVAEEAFAVIREAMRKRNVVGLARVVLHRRERILMLEPRGKGLFAATLRYGYEVRADDAYFEDIPDVELPEEMLDLAAHIIERKAGHFEPETFEDRYENAVVALIRSKQTGEPMRTAATPKPSNVVNLMDALKKSLASEKPDKAPAKAGEKPTAKAPAAKSAPSKTAAKAAERAPEPAPARAPSKRGAAKPAAASKGRSSARPYRKTG